MKVAESWNMDCHDWIISGRQEQYLLDRDTIASILQDLLHLELSPQLMEYLLCSIAYLPETHDLSINRLKPWVKSLERIRCDALFETALTHQHPRIREGGIRIIERLGDPHLAENVLNHLESERDLRVKRASVRCLRHLGKKLPHDVAQDLLKHDPDWVVQSYALSHLPETRSCLLIPDGTDFAVELGRMAHDAGFALVTVSAPLAFYPITKMQDIETEALKAHGLLILVKGEHYMRAEGHDYYSNIRQFVIEGGHLFATSWVCWENAYNDELTDLLPFSHLHDTSNENVEITCHATESELAQRLFPERISYCASFERLQRKADAVVLSETEDHLPIFGFRRLGKGVCYYFNTCQHVCFGTMSSPFSANSQLANSFQRVFQWIFDTLQHETAAVALERAEITRAMFSRMISLVELRDPKEGPHANRVGAYASEIYEKWALKKELSQKTIETYKDILRMAAMLHDLGKVGIKDDILQKPGRLTPEEYAQMKQHTVKGARLFIDPQSEFDRIAGEIALNHHECWDGAGYPGGKQGETIPLFARLVAIADVYDELIFREGFEEEDAAATVKKGRGTRFDPEMIDAFEACFDTIRLIRQRFPNKDA